MVNTPDFTPDRLRRLSQLEHWHFWFVGRRALVQRLLRKYLNNIPRQVLDLGCGTGFMLETLTRQNHRVIGMDMLSEGLRSMHQLLPEAPLLQSSAMHLPLKRATCDLVILMDVLEHVDDQETVSEIYRVLRTDGLALITVPAIPWLWSYRDKAAGHRCRYTRHRLSALLTDTKFEILEMHYYQFFCFPLVLITRLFGRNQPTLRDMEETPQSLTNTVLTWINKLEVRLGRIISWPWGSSLVTICQKK